MMRYSITRRYPVSRNIEFKNNIDPITFKCTKRMYVNEINNSKCEREICCGNINNSESTCRRNIKHDEKYTTNEKVLIGLGIIVGAYIIIRLILPAILLFFCFIIFMIFKD